MTGTSPPGAESLHRRILADIEERIRSGAWRPGDRIPSEQVLAEWYGCSRMTVNKALTPLAKAGSIERRRRAGSFVRQPHAWSAVLEIHTVERESTRSAAHIPIAGWGSGSDRPGPTRPRWSAPDAPVLDLQGLHLSGGAPYCLEERLISLDAVPAARDADFHEEPPSAWLLRQVPWRIAEHVVGAESASAGTARHLEIDAGAACLTVERRTWDADRVVTRVRRTYPADRHRVVARFAPTRP